MWRRVNTPLRKRKRGKKWYQFFSAVHVYICDWFCWAVFTALQQAVPETELCAHPRSLLWFHVRRALWLRNPAHRGIVEIVKCWLRSLSMGTKGKHTPIEIRLQTIKKNLNHFHTHSDFESRIIWSDLFYFQHNMNNIVFVQQHNIRYKCNFELKTKFMHRFQINISWKTSQS